MTDFKSGETYRDPNTGNQFTVTEDVDTAGMPRHEAEYVTVTMESEDGEVYGFDYEQVEHWPRVSGDTDSLTDEDREVIRDRARESWGKLAREFGVTEDDIREVITG